MKNRYATYDMPLAVTLLYHEERLIDIEWGLSRRAQFVFEQTERLDSLIEDFWAKRLQVEPLSFLLVEKEIKSRLYSQQ